MKNNLTGFVATTVAWAAIAIAVTVLLGYRFHVEMVWNSLMLGAIVAAPATLITLAFGGVRNIGAHVLVTGLLSGALHIGLSMLLEAPDGSWALALVTAGYGIGAAAVGSTVVRAIYPSTK